MVRPVIRKRMAYSGCLTYAWPRRSGEINSNSLNFHKPVDSVGHAGRDLACEIHTHCALLARGRIPPQLERWHRPFPPREREPWRKRLIRTSEWLDCVVFIRRNDPTQSRRAAGWPLLAARKVPCNFQHRDGPCQVRQGLRLDRATENAVYLRQHLSPHRMMPPSSERGTTYLVVRTRRYKPWRRWPSAISRVFEVMRHCVWLFVIFSSSPARSDSQPSPPI